MVGVANKRNDGIFVCLSLLFCLFSLLPECFAWQTTEFAEVNIDTKKLFTVTNVGDESAQARSQDIENRLRTVLIDQSVKPSDVTIKTGLDGVPVIAVKDMDICLVTDGDSQAFGLNRQQLAQQWADRIRIRLQQLKPLFKDQKTQEHPLSEHAVLLLIVELGVILLCSLCCGELFVRLGQPAIIGQIFSGILLGRTVLGHVFPDLYAVLFPIASDQSQLVEVVSWIGVIFVLMLTGMETDVGMLKRFGRTTAYVAALGVAVPLALGAGVSFLLPSEFVMHQNLRIALALFLGTAFAVSSVPVVAKVLMDMGLLKRDIGQLVLATALSHDLLCCLLFAVLAAVAATGDGSQTRLLTAPLGTLLFVAAAWFGRPLVFAILRFVNDKVSSSEGLLTAIAVLLLFSAATTEALGVHVVLGAFAVGVLLSQAPVVNKKVIRPIESMTMGIFAPIFFASSGINVDLLALLKPEVALITALLLVLAIAGKLGGCYLGAKLSGLDKWQAVAIGIGANSRGSMGLILAMLGFSLGIITTDLMAIVIFISLVSTAFVPPCLKWALSFVQATAEETIRLQQQERQSKTIMHQIRRILWPTSGKGKANLAAAFVNAIGANQVIETTVLTAEHDGSAVKAKDFIRNSGIDGSKISLSRRSVQTKDPAQAVNDEASRGYDLIIFGTQNPPASSDRVFGKLIDEVLIKTSVPALVIYDPKQGAIDQCKHVLVPVSGSDLSMRAGEFGILLAKSLNASITCVCITEAQSSELYSEKTQSGDLIEERLSKEIEESLSELSGALGVEFKTLVRYTGEHVAQTIILTAEQIRADLIVLGAEPKLGQGLFLGHTVNFVLRNASCAVAVLKL